MGKYAIIIISLFFYTSTYSAQLTRTEDINGWTIFTPSSDTKVVYVSTSGNDSTCVAYDYDDALIGSDPFEPTGAVVPCATPSVAYGKVSARTGYPDWILYKRGDTFTTSIGSNFRSGRDADEPFLVGAYGSSGLSPLFEVSSGFSYESSLEWIAFSGLSFYANTADPDNVDYVGSQAGAGFDIRMANGESAQGVLVEGCKFRFFKGNYIGVVTYSTGAFNGGEIRRAVILDSYLDGNTQGLWMWDSDNIIVDECVFDHNGWYDDSTGTTGVATALSHTMYVSYDQYVTIKNSIISRSTGLKFIAFDNADQDSYGHDVVNNLFIDNEIGVSLGNNKTTNVERFFNIEINNNVFYATGLNSPTGSSSKWDIWASGWVGGTINNNLFINSAVTGSNSSTIRFYDNMTNVNVMNNVDVGQVDAAWSVYHVINTALTDASNILFSGNMFEASGTYQKYIDVGSGVTPGEYTFINNTWYSPTTTSFTLGGSTYTEAQWSSSIESTATFTQPIYTDRTRTPITYQTSIGGTATLDAFIVAVRAQDRYDWDVDYDTDLINDYLRTGFDLEEYNLPPTQTASRY